jgi:hypothetical protein
MSATMTRPGNSSRMSTPDRRPKRVDASTSVDLARIRSEYIEMPGLVLTLPQAARLWGLGTQRAAELLDVLLDAGFLACDKRAVYRRRR